MKTLSVLIFFLVVPLLLKGQQYWGTTPTIDANGVMEIGKIVDFHETSDDLNDYSVRLFSSGGVLKLNALFNPASLLLTDPNGVTDWNLLWQSGFFDGISAANAPEPSGWFWGINMNHRSNGTEYRYNGQLAIKNSPTSPTMFFRSTNSNGVGTWAKVLHSQGNQQINGALTLTVENPIITLKDVSGSQYDGDFLYKDNSLHYRWGQGIKHTFEPGAYVIGDYNGEHEVKLSMTGDSWINGGNVGIGTTTPDSKLTVKGTIHTQEIKVDLTGALVPDYVFEEGYPLPSLPEIEAYIKTNKHLPEVPSAKEMEENGMNLKRMNLLLLKKIEELTLYLIQLEEKNNNIEQENQELKEYYVENNKLLQQLMVRIKKLENE